MRAKDKCPSCYQPVAPTDFLCSNCELILDLSQVDQKPVTDVSVVRRMLEAPQGKMPTAKPSSTRLPKQALEGLEGPTRVLDLGPELSGVPVVVATLSRKTGQLSELEAWVVSLIDGLHDAKALAEKAGVREFELRVVLRTLNEKHIIDFADEPLSDADLDMPEVLGTLAMEEPPPPAPSYGANVDRRDARFVAPPSQAPVVSGLQGIVERSPPPTSFKAPPPPPALMEPRRAAVAPAYPGGALARPSLPQKPPEPELLPPAPVERTDPRIVYTGPANRKVLDALKKVKRIDAKSEPTPQQKKEIVEQNVDDVLARETLQVALRMEQRGRFEEAIRFLEKSISQSPEAPSLYNRLGIILMRERQDYRRAEQMIKKALELSPDNSVFEQNLRMVIQKQALKQAR
jgi:tetratricopeptide (TPR) repeat protein